MNNRPLYVANTEPRRGVRPSTLRAGMRVRRVDGPEPSFGRPVLSFVHRDSQRRQSVLQGEAYRGQNGPSDEGYVVVSDYDMSRCYARVPA